MIPIAGGEKMKKSLVQGTPQATEVQRVLKRLSQAKNRLAFTGSLALCNAVESLMLDDLRAGT